MRAVAEPESFEGPLGAVPLLRGSCLHRRTDLLPPASCVLTYVFPGGSLGHGVGVGVGGMLVPAVSHFFLSLALPLSLSVPLSLSLSVCLSVSLS